MVTHPSTNPLARSLSTGERTGSFKLCNCWFDVLGIDFDVFISLHCYLPADQQRWQVLVHVILLKIEIMLANHQLLFLQRHEINDFDVVIPSTNALAHDPHICVCMLGHILRERL